MDKFIAASAASSDTSMMTVEKGWFSTSMLVYRRIYIYICVYIHIYIYMYIYIYTHMWNIEYMY